MARKKLPIGIQTFAQIREDDVHYYANKTPLALQLITQNKYFPLSRPCRFDKRLFPNTFQERFECSQALFKELHTEKHWDWPLRYPVLRISFGGGVLESRDDLQASLHTQLTLYKRKHGIAAQFPNVHCCFIDLIRHLAQTTGQRRVVVLADKHDRPILHRIKDREKAIAIRDVLKDFYSTIRDRDVHIRFAFLKGASQFSKASLFSGLNNFPDITLDQRYNSICGRTDTNVDTVFAPKLEGLDWEGIRRWYNSYNWLGEPAYSPFDLLLLFDHRQFRRWWFDTGTPTFLVKLLAKRQQFTPNLESVPAPKILVSTFDMDAILTEALIFQAGYLTIASAEIYMGGMDLTLRYPDCKVKTCLDQSLLDALCGDIMMPSRNVSRLHKRQRRCTSSAWSSAGRSRTSPVSKH